jgi:formate dehydrogenase major subunit
VAYRAVKPIAACRPDLEIIDGLAKAMKRAYEKEGVFPEPIRHLAWDYGHEADPHKVARELNGRYLADVTQPDGTRIAAGKQVSGFAQLRDDGSTMSGNWIYCGAIQRKATWRPSAMRPTPSTASGSIRSGRGCGR